MQIPEPDNLIEKQQLLMRLSKKLISAVIIINFVLFLIAFGAWVNKEVRLVPPATVIDSEQELDSAVKVDPIVKSSNAGYTLSVEEGAMKAEEREELEIRDDQPLDTGEFIPDHHDLQGVAYAKNNIGQQPDVTFEAVDPSSIPIDTLEKFQTGDYKRYRFVRISGEAIRARIKSLSMGDTFSLELFPNESLVLRQTYSQGSQGVGSGDSISWSGSIENQPCSVMNIVINPGGAIQLSSFHRHVNEYSAVPIGQDFIYAITQSIDEYTVPCGG